MKFIRFIVNCFKSQKKDSKFEGGNRIGFISDNQVDFTIDQNGRVFPHPIAIEDRDKEYTISLFRGYWNAGESREKGVTYRRCK